MNCHENELCARLDSLEKLLDESRELERRLRALPEQARALLDDWAGAHAPLFQEGYEVALACLSGTTRLEAIPREKPAQALGWSPGAVGADTKYRSLANHDHRIGPIVAEQQGARARALRVAWDEQMESLLELARRLTAPAIPARALEFQERCRLQLEMLERERGGRDFEILSRVVLSDLKKELGQLGLSWELKRSLSEPIDAFLR